MEETEPENYGRSTPVYGAPGQNGRCSPHFLRGRLVLRRRVFAADFFANLVAAFLAIPPFAALLLFLVVLPGLRLGPFAALESVFVALFAAPADAFQRLSWPALLQF
jgi:hypothetical protein